jgi:hypothetical protein
MEYEYLSFRILTTFQNIYETVKLSFESQINSLLGFELDIENFNIFGNYFGIGLCERFH